MVESLHVRSTRVGVAAITCRKAKSVLLKRLLVEHPEGGIGILFEHCHGLRIEEVEVRAVLHGSVAARPLECSVQYNDCDNVNGKESENVVIQRVRVQGGSSSF